MTDPAPTRTSDRALGAAAGFGAAWILLLAWMGAEFEPYLGLYADFQAIELPALTTVTLSVTYRLGMPMALSVALFVAYRRGSPWLTAAVAGLALTAVVLLYVGATLPIRELANPILEP